LPLGATAGDLGDLIGRHATLHRAVDDDAEDEDPEEG